MRSAISPRLASLFLAALSACDGSPPVADAGPDAPQLQPSTLFGPCVSDSQCPGAGAVCRTVQAGWPSGVCTVPCSDRTPCDHDGVYHHCVRREGETQSYCERRCLNGIDCRREGYTCVGEVPPSGGTCEPVCASDAECGDGTHCDRYTGRCTVEPSSTTGGVTGDPCEEDDDCRSGDCIADTNRNGGPTGWVHGLCVGRCILPSGYNSNTLFSGDRLPTATCPGDAVCFPFEVAQSRGDLGTCLDQCEENDDCREGYTCLTRFQLSSGGTASFDNGVCVPANCQTAGCPEGYECVGVTDSNGDVRPTCARIR